MKKISFILIYFLIGLSILSAQTKEVHLAKIDGEIDLGLAPFVKRAVQEAEENNADAIIFEINTFGGRVDAATQIKDAILNSSVLTIAFINKRAISAGALISLSCKKIAMVPGASIGATTVVNQQGKKVSEKYQSYMRSEMRSTAEQNGRRKDIAEGMVDKRVVVKGLVDSTQLITLTTEEAVKYGMADTSVNNTREVLKAFGLEGAAITKVSSNWGEEVVSFLNSPVISSLLMMLGLVGLYAEIKSPGWGIPGTIAIVSLALFFGSGYILEMVSIIEIIIFAAGVAFIILEIFVIPGFGVFGILGIIMMVAGLFMGLLSDLPYFNWNIVSTAITQLAVAMLLSILMFYLLSKLLPKSTKWNRLILQEDIHETSGYTSTPQHSKEYLVGKEGTAYTDLRPSGTAEIEDERIDVVTQGEYILSGSKVVVSKTEGSKVIVKEKKV